MHYTNAKNHDQTTAALRQYEKLGVQVLHFHMVLVPLLPLLDLLGKVLFLVRIYCNDVFLE